MRNNIFIACIFFLVALFQVSFLPHFSFFGLVMPATAFLVFLAALLEHPLSLGSFTGAVAGGGVLDFFSQTFFGFWVIAFLLLAFFAKYVIKNYVRIP